ncbi:MAG: hypothetical protein EBY22_10810 [Gammaproteobacteria bacterium]|nr:hypothetical protein [Gammaproteobacteria bacterium]
MAELTRRFLQGRNNLEFYFRESLVSEQPDAIDLVHIPTGLVCLYDDETRSVNLSTWYEEAAGPAVAPCAPMAA